MADDKKEIQPAASNTGGTPTPPVAGNTPGGSPSNAPAAPDPQPSAIEIGKLGYKFRFPVESPEGQQERREHDTKYRANRRASARAVAATLDNPPPLPPATAPLAGGQTPPSPGGPVPPDASQGAPIPESIPWEPELITDLLGELIEAAEENRVAAYVVKCKEAGLLPKLCKEIENDAHFPKLSKKVLARSLPRLAAKYLNKTGVSAEYQDEVAVFASLILIAWKDRNISKRFAEHFEEKKKTEAQSSAPPENKTP